MSLTNLGLLHLRPREVCILFAFIVNSSNECNIGAFRQSTLFIQNREDPCTTIIDKIQSHLVVCEFNIRPLDSFVLIFRLLCFENKPIELLLKNLIAVVDA